MGLRGSARCVGRATGELHSRSLGPRRGRSLPRYARQSAATPLGKETIVRLAGGSFAKGRRSSPKWDGRERGRGDSVKRVIDPCACARRTDAMVGNCVTSECRDGITARLGAYRPPNCTSIRGGRRETQPGAANPTQALRSERKRHEPNPLPSRFSANRSAALKPSPAQPGFSETLDRPTADPDPYVSKCRRPSARGCGSLAAYNRPAGP